MGTTTSQIATGIPLHMPVCMRFFEESIEEELHRGIVTQSLGGNFTVHVLDAVLAPDEISAEFYYRDESHKFVRVQASLIESEIGEEGTTFRMKLAADQGRYAEQRNSFRVSVADQGMKIMVESHKDCRALDVSAEGIGVVVPKAFKVGQCVNVNISFDGRRIDGMMTVRTIRERKDKMYRCGLQIPSRSKDMLKAFQSISMAVQRELLCRLAAADAEAKRMEEMRSNKDRTRHVEGKLIKAPQDQNTDDATQSADDCVLLRLPLGEASKVRLPAALLDDKGEIVLSAGDMLRPDVLKALGEVPLYLSKGWLSRDGEGEGDESADDKSGIDNRNHYRRKWEMKIPIVLENKDCTRYIQANTIDLSRGGYSFTTKRAVEEGATLRADIPLGKRVFTVSGTVRHCTQFGDYEFHVGVEFNKVTARDNQMFDVG